MTEIFTYGRFEVEPQNEESFFEAWSEMATWASTLPGSHTFRLVRDTRNPGRFISLGQWDDPEAVRAFKSAPEFKERLAGMVKQAKEFEPTELVPLQRAEAGHVETFSSRDDVEPIHAPT
jgi:heme-degrading monooxygenase HmoA